jgi:hypothetical protein
MPLTDAERNHIIEMEEFKDELRRLLQNESPRSKLSQFWQHPAVLLVLGFLCTGAAGAWLTSYWKQSEWNNQQDYLVTQRSLDRKSALIEATFKEVSSTTAAADDLLATYYGDWTHKDVEERWDNWKKTSLTWRIQAKVLTARLAANFSNKDVQKQFEEIVDGRRQLGNIIVNLPRPMRNKKIGKNRMAEVRAATKLINEISDRLSECGFLMAEELPKLEHRRACLVASLGL